MPHKNKINLPLKESMPVESASLLRWLYFFARPYRGVISTFIVYRAIRYSLMSILPLAIGFTIDAFNAGKVAQNPSFYIWILFGYLFLYFILASTNMIFYWEVRAYEKATRGLTLFSMNHITALPLEWHERQGSGGKMQRVMTARKSFFELARIFRWVMFPIFGSLVGVVVSMMTMNAPYIYILMFFGFFATYSLTSWYLGRPVVNLYDKHNETFEKLLSGVYEFISSIRTVKSFGIQDYIGKRAGDLEHSGLMAIERVYWRVFIRWACINGVGTLWLIAFAAVGFKGAYEGSITTGTFAATFFLAVTMWTNLENFAEVQEQMYEHVSGLRRLIGTLREKIRPVDIAPLQTMPDDWREITLDNVCFSYSGSREYGIQDVSLRVRRGEKIAFVGASGAGKTTMAKLIMKQALPVSGAIRIDGIDLSHIPVNDWLSKIGFVPQDVELFNMTIRQNILIDRDDLDESIYRRALTLSALDEFIDSLPEGDDTIVGERGIKLSGGQKQRLGIARALVRQADILVFDEATSALDSISEQQIQQAMENSFTGHTVFLIAHRLSTIRHVDRIIVMDKGHLIEEGSFEALLKKNGAFAKLWNIQSATQNEIC